MQLSQEDYCKISLAPILVGSPLSFSDRLCFLDKKAPRSEQIQAWLEENRDQILAIVEELRGSLKEKKRVETKKGGYTLYTIPRGLERVGERGPMSS